MVVLCEFIGVILSFYVEVAGQARSYHCSELWVFINL